MNLFHCMVKEFLGILTGLRVILWILFRSRTARSYTDYKAALQIMAIVFLNPKVYAGSDVESPIMLTTCTYLPRGADQILLSWSHAIEIL